MATSLDHPPKSGQELRFDVQIETRGVTLDGVLSIPARPLGVVIFAHGSGSSRHSPRNQFVAERLHAAGLATLLMDLLTPEEEQLDNRTHELRFDIRLLSDRLCGATEWLSRQPRTRHLKVGLFGASTGGGAAIMTAAREPTLVGAVVSRGGRVDLASDYLTMTRCPTLLIVGGNDQHVLDLNGEAILRLRAPIKRLAIVRGASHLFEEPGALDEVALLSATWLRRHLGVDGSPGFSE